MISKWRFSCHFLLGVLAFSLAPAVAAGADFGVAKRAYDQADYATALKELTSLAENGNAEAQVLLGTMYQKGQGVAKNSPLALKWFRAAAGQGNADGQFQVGLAYLNGMAVAKNTPESVKWLKLAANQGMRDAQLFLGLAYRNLRDAPQDFVQAYLWFELAALAGDPLAPRQRDALGRLMTPAQVANARAMAAAWKPTHTVKQAGEGSNSAPEPPQPSGHPR